MASNTVYWDGYGLLDRDVFLLFIKSMPMKGRLSICYGSRRMR